MKQLLLEKDRWIGELTEKVESYSAKQEFNNLMTTARNMKSESAMRQFIAFAKCKCWAVDAKRAIENGNLGAAADPLDKIADLGDFRMDLCMRADSMPGGWGTANIYEQQAKGNLDLRNDKGWSRVNELYKNKQAEKRKETRNKPDQDRDGSNRFQGTSIV